MKKILLLYSLFFALSIRSILAQIGNDSLMKFTDSLEPVILLNQKRLINWQSVAKTVKLNQFKAGINSNEIQSLGLKQNLFIQQAEIMVIRDGDMIAKAFWQKGQPDPLNNFTQLIKKGDRYIIEFTLTVQTNNGEIVTLKNKPVFNLPLQ